MRLRNLFKKRKTYNLEVYEEDELHELEDHIGQTYGEFNKVIHEIVSTDIHVDIAIVPAAKDRPYLTLVTMGMGAHAMNVPKELKEQQLEHAEIMVQLPADWNIENDIENDYWPIRWLKILARLPIEQETWLGYGHTISSEGTLSDNTKFCGVGLVGGTDTLHLSSGKVIHFYTMIPMYQEEIMRKEEEGNIAAVIDQFQVRDRSYIVDIQRRNYGI